jgi:hypothetical protein
VKKNNLTLVIFLLVGLMAGTIIGDLLSTSEFLQTIFQNYNLSWNPSADFIFIDFKFAVNLNMNVLSFVGLACAFWLHRKL